MWDWIIVCTFTSKEKEMGACNFSDIGIAKTANEAYRELCDEAEEEYGHQDGYNGTISTTYGFSKVSGNPRFGTKAFYKWEEKKRENVDKCDCLYLEVTGAVATRLKARYGYKGKRGLKVFYFFGIARE